MNYKRAWEILKADIERAVEEGYECNYNDPDSEEYDKFYVYQYVNDKMDNLEKGDLIL